jgi:predicted NUDIX family NTP pyrophosphohydrolase
MKQSAGILAYRRSENNFEVFLVHPGGPYWKNKDQHAWSIPKGEFDAVEAPFNAALREFKEETGFSVSGNFIEFNPVKQPGGKIIFIWAIEADFDPETIKSNSFSLEWPPKSGKMIDVPEIDKAGWFTPGEARQKIHKGQIPVLEQLAKKLNFLI